MDPPGESVLVPAQVVMMKLAVYPGAIVPEQINFIETLGDRETHGDNSGQVTAVHAAIKTFFKTFPTLEFLDAFVLLDRVVIRRHRNFFLDPLFTIFEIIYPDLAVNACLSVPVLRIKIEVRPNEIRRLVKFESEIDPDRNLVLEPIKIKTIKAVPSG